MYTVRFGWLADWIYLEYYPIHKRFISDGSLDNTMGFVGIRLCIHAGANDDLSLTMNAPLLSMTHGMSLHIGLADWKWLNIGANFTSMFWIQRHCVNSLDLVVKLVRMHILEGLAIVYWNAFLLLYIWC